MRPLYSGPRILLHLGSYQHAQVLIAGNLTRGLTFSDISKGGPDKVLSASFLELVSVQ